MIRNYFKIAWRNLIKNKGYSAINIGGLAVGMAVAMVIGLWIYGELSFNKNHKNHDRIARVMQHIGINGTTDTWGALPSIMGKGLRDEYGSDFKYVIRASWIRNHALSFGNKVFTKKGAFFEPDITEMLSLNIVSGTPSALKEINSILLSQSMAITIFGDEDPVGEILKLDYKTDVKVTGVYKDLPENAAFNKLYFILPWDLYVSQNAWLKEHLKEKNPWFPGGKYQHMSK